VGTALRAFAHTAIADATSEEFPRGQNRSRAVLTREQHVRRFCPPYACSFFTLALADRRSDLLVRHIERLQRAYAGVEERLPFTTVAICILPDHIHAVWQLPDGDADYASRWSLFKSGFSRGLAPAPTRSPSKIAKREKGIWQRRYWEHAIRDDADLERHVDYIHYNPVKHGLVTRLLRVGIARFCCLVCRVG
jgi:putative transposase